MEVQLLGDLLLRRSIFSFKNMYIPFFHYMFDGSEQMSGVSQLFWPWIVDVVP